MQIVSEFMIYANVVVAEKIYSAFPDSALLRRHPIPASNQSFEDVSRFVVESWRDWPFNRCTELLGVKLNTSSNLALAQSLDKVDIKFNNEKNVQNKLIPGLIRSITALALSEAE